MSITENHRLKCKDPSRTRAFIGVTGEAMISCRSCGRAWPDPGQSDGGTPHPSSTPRPSTGWVCRDHPDQPVDPKGRGCPVCHPPTTPTAPRDRGGVPTPWGG